MPIFGNFGPLGAAEDIKIFFNFFLFFPTHTKRQLFFAITFQDSKFLFFTARYC